MVRFTQQNGDYCICLKSCIIKLTEMDSLLSCLVCLNVNVAVFDLELKNVSKFDAVNRRFHAFDVF